MLGDQVGKEFDGRLPFLMKVLAAAEPLSLQVHPTSERARIGYVRENQAGIPLDAPERSYKDPSHKPELIFALTRFEGMAGFRDLDRTAAILRLLNLDWADDLAEILQDSPTPFQTLRKVVTHLLQLDRQCVTDRIAELGAAAARAEEIGHQSGGHARPTRRSREERDAVGRESVRVFAQTVQLAERYPHDAGVLVTLLLNHVVLAAGEAMYLGAGVIHAYTSGLGVEVMASSDNVLRAGLTPKHMDVPELLAITDFTPSPPPMWADTTQGATGSVRCFEPPVSEFALQVADCPTEELAGSGPRIVLVLAGEVVLRTAAQRLELGTGESAFVPHADGPLVVEGTGRVALACPPTDLD